MLTELELLNAERDVSDLALVVNGSASAPDVVTRLGQSIKPLAKVIAEASGSGGFEPPVAFGAGLNMVRSSQTVTYLDSTYSASPAAIPFITTGVFDPAQWNLLIVKSLLSRAELKALAAPANGTILMMIDGAKTGVFKYTTANIKPLCDADPLEGLFVKRTGTDGSTGGWARSYDGPTISWWWGVATTNTAAQNVTAFRAALTALAAAAAVTGQAYFVAGSIPLYTPGGHYLFNDELKPDGVAVDIYGDSVILGGGTVFEWSGSSGHGINILGWDGGGFTAANYHGTGCSVRKLTLVGWYAGGARSAQHAVNVNGQARCDQLFFKNWPGIGCYASADVGTSSGNDNNSSFTNLYGEGCDLTLKLEHGDANACYVSNIQAQNNRLGSYWDWSFLGCWAFGVHAENCGLDTNFRSRCVYSGHTYVVAYGQEAWCSTHAPSGTTAHNQGWLYLNDDGVTFYSALWVTGQTWYFTAPVSIGPPDNGNTLGRVYGGYIEGGQNPVIIAPGAFFEPSTVCTVWIDADLATHHGSPAGGSFRGSYEDMTLNNTLRLPGHIIMTGDRAELGPSSGAGADTTININTTNTHFLNFNRYNAGGGLIANDGSVRSVFGTMYWDGVFGHNFRYNGTTITTITSDGFKPGNDNALKLGDASLRWSTVYAGTGTINTSDARLKRVLAIDDELLDAWADVEWGAHQWLDAIAQKGEDKARIHFGVIAQQVKAAFDKRGIDGFRYGVLCYDEWQHLYEPEFSEESYIVEVKVPLARPHWNRKQHKTHRDYLDSLTPDQRAGFKTVASPATRQIAKLDPKGKPVMKIKRRAGDSFGIRYGEALALEAAYQRRRADRIEDRLVALETTVERLAAH